LQSAYSIIRSGLFACYPQLQCPRSTVSNRMLGSHGQLCIDLDLVRVNFKLFRGVGCRTPASAASLGGVDDDPPAGAAEGQQVQARVAGGPGQATCRGSAAGERGEADVGQSWSRPPPRPAWKRSDSSMYDSSWSRRRSVRSLGASVVTNDGRLTISTEETAVCDANVRCCGVSPAGELGRVGLVSGPCCSSADCRCCLLASTSR
jgi:hypothetical protein